MPEGPVLCAQAIIDRSGAANLIVLLRVRMGFPAESFAPVSYTHLTLPTSDLV